MTLVGDIEIGDRHYQSLVVEYNIGRYLELTENQTAVPHHCRISTLVKHCVKQRLKDSSLDLQQGNKFMKYLFLRGCELPLYSILVSVGPTLRCSRGWHSPISGCVSHEGGSP